MALHTFYTKILGNSPVKLSQTQQVVVVGFQMWGERKNKIVHFDESTMNFYYLFCLLNAKFMNKNFYKLPIFN